jgi:deoxyribodipyrimidine photo-lyase
VKKNKTTVIHWFRQDLRLSDNPAFLHAVKNGQVLPIYILDDESSKKYKMGAASRWWLHHSLSALNESLNGFLHVYQGHAKDVLQNLVDTHNVTAIYWNRCYEPWRIYRDIEIKNSLESSGVEVKSFNGSLLWEPWHVLKKDDTPYRVFTPFYRRKCLTVDSPSKPLAAPCDVQYFEGNVESSGIENLALLPKIDWSEKLANHWDIGEKAAQACLDLFLENGIYDYKEGRNFPAKKKVSRLSAYLHFGEISSNQIWYDVQMTGSTENQDHLLSELGWREFANSLLYHFPDFPHKNLQSRFDVFPWVEDEESLKKWQMGQTGYPIVDAGMRELWQTGYMHNRVRMIVGSFLVKNLLLHWHHGADWFWDCLVDADLANNSAGWQWIAGCGADAAPFFRIFNPITQGEKFDKSGEYTKRFVPELKDMPDKYLFKPWEAPVEVLKQAGVVLGKDYPYPVIDVKSSRERALKAFQATRNIVK